MDKQPPRKGLQSQTRTIRVPIDLHQIVALMENVKGCDTMADVIRGWAEADPDYRVIAEMLEKLEAGRSKKVSRPGRR